MKEDAIETEIIEKIETTTTGNIKETEEEMSRILGAAYGRYCIERLGVRWAVIKDQLGTDTALVRENPTSRGFPFTSIQYRIEDKKTDFLYALYASLKHLIENST